MMHRNLDARVEAVTPINNDKLRAYLDYMFQLYLTDNQQRWMLDSRGDHSKVVSSENQPIVSVHSELMNHMDLTKSPIPQSW